MPSSGDLIDFDVIETQKENIQSLPSGRSAKTLAAVFLSPAHKTTPSQTQELNDAIRQEYEKELVLIDESDDPLDIYDRYVRWTLNAYPSAQATPQSQLLPLLERATKSFLTSTHYKNDPRYLKLWIHYIRFFCDAPRETFAYLARRGIGEGLALYYEEFATWLEGAGRWHQAEEVYKLGLEKEARPAERLMRKFGDFERRMTATATDPAEPNSPALPTVRPALASKTDPFASAAPAPDYNPQANPRHGTGSVSKKPKMEIFSDTSSTTSSVVGIAAAGWASIGTRADRRKENTVTAQPWAGEKLENGTKTNSGMSKLMVFKDESERMKSTLLAALSANHPARDQIVVNPKTGRTERVAVNLEAVYPDPSDLAMEMCFEELRAAKRGWLQKDWGAYRRSVMTHSAGNSSISPRQGVRLSTDEESIDGKTLKTEQHIIRQRESNPSGVPLQPTAWNAAAPTYCVSDVLLVEGEGLKTDFENDEDAVPQCKKDQPPKLKKNKLQILNDDQMKTGATGNNRQQSPKKDREKLAIFCENDENASQSRLLVRKDELARRLRREERANKTRKIQLHQETQTVQTKLSSPKGPKLRRKRTAEPTMTLHSKAAAEEIYEMFNQPLKSTLEEGVTEPDSDASSDSDDDYISASESTGTGKASCATSEFGEDTQGDVVEAGESAVLDDQTSTDFSEHTNRKDVEDEPDENDGRETNGDTGCSEAEVHLEKEPGEKPPQTAMLAPQDGLTTPIEQEALLAMEENNFMPQPPQDFQMPVRSYRDTAQTAQNRLPFMTPIVEKTESSLGASTMRQRKDYFNSKTPCPRSEWQTPNKANMTAEIWSPLTESTTPALHERANQSIPTPAKSQSKLRRTNISSVQRRAVETPIGPVIKDTICNPMDTTIHATILAHMRHALATLPGYHVHTSASFPPRRGEIRRFTKAVTSAVRSKAVSERTTCAPALPPVLRFPGATHEYVVQRELGKGAYAPVYLVERRDLHVEPQSEDEVEHGRAVMGQGRFAVRRARLEALKMEDPASAWEFHMLRLAHRRLGVSRAAASVVRAHEMHLCGSADVDPTAAGAAGDDAEGFMLLDYMGHGTLLDVVNGMAAEPGASGPGLDEPLAMLLAIELLRTVEALHAKDILHADLKPDNVLLRLELPSSSASASTSASTSSSAPSGAAALPARWTRDGAHGWAGVGVLLIDMGRGVDMRAFVPEVQFVADWAAGAQDAPELREGRRWTRQVDCHGLAACLHTLLFGRYMEMAVAAPERGSGAECGTGVGAVGPGARRYRLREPLKRYWATEVWGEAFEVLLNSGQRMATGGGAAGLARELARVRAGMEDWLEGNADKGVGLRGLVRRLEAVLERRGRRV